MKARAVRDRVRTAGRRGQAGEVVVTWLTLDPVAVAVLQSAGLSVRFVPKRGRRTPAELRALLGDGVAAIVSTDPFDRSVLEAAAELRVIARVGVGVDSIDVDAATRHGVVVTITPGANDETVADHTLALMLAVLRRLRENDDSVRRGEWERAGRLTGWELHRRTVGLVGYGRIGAAVARRLRAFDASLLVADPALSAAEGGELVQLDELLVRADVVSLHAPLTEQTRRMIGPRELDLMRPHAVLVNTSRGGVVDEKALVAALCEGRLRGAGLDVFSREPAVAPELTTLANVVLTPHVGGLSEQSIERMVQRAARSVVEVLEGRPDLDVVVNPEALAHPRIGAASSG